MAIFGIDFYGLSTYGAKVSIEYGIAPFIAEAISPTQISLTWSEPKGDWSTFRVLVNRSGYSINPDDGVSIYEVSGKTTGSTTDEVSGSGWDSYTVFIYNNENQSWERAGVDFAWTAGSYDYTST